MTISSGGFNINLNPMPTTFEKETTGQVSQKNAGEVRGNAVIVPQSQSDDVSFVVMDNRNKWDYKAEQERPSLRPNSLFIGSGVEVKESGDGVTAHYNELLNQLPEDTKLELAGLPTVFTAALKFVIEAGADALESMDRALLQIQTENALARSDEIKKMPDKSYHAALQIGNEMASITEKWVQRIGENDPAFTESMEFLKDTSSLLKGTSHDS